MDSFFRRYSYQILAKIIDFLKLHFCSSSIATVCSPIYFLLTDCPSYSVKKLRGVNDTMEFDSAVSMTPWISPQNWNHLQKYFSIWKTSPDGLESWKKWWSKSCDTIPFNLQYVFWTCIIWIIYWWARLRFREKKLRFSASLQKAHSSAKLLESVFLIRKELFNFIFSLRKEADSSHVKNMI